MKKIISFFGVVLIAITMLFASCATTKVEKKRWYQDNPKIEVVNETTVIFKDVLRIEVRSCKHCVDQVTYVYDLKHSKLMKVAKGSFEVDLPRGNYLIQSNKKITKMDYEVIIE